MRRDQWDQTPPGRRALLRLAAGLGAVATVHLIAADPAATPAPAPGPGRAAPVPAAAAGPRPDGPTGPPPTGWSR